MRIGGRNLAVLIAIAVLGIAFGRVMGVCPSPVSPCCTGESGCSR
jgi:hypothetical protein